MLTGKILDGFYILRRLTPGRFFNAWRITSSYILSRIFRRSIIRGLPMSVSIEPTTSCNLRCPECPSGLRAFTRATGMLSESHFQSWIEQIKSHVLYLNLYFQGEPFLNPAFLLMVKYASDRGIYVSTSTNAHYLKNDIAEQVVRSGLNRLIISLDGTTQQVYEQYRIGGLLERVLQAVENVVAAKRKLRSRTPYLIFQFLVVKPNEHQIEDARKMTKDFGVDEIRFKTAQIYGNPEESGLLPDNPRYARYKKNKEGQYVIKNKQLNHCWKMWHSCVITWDGKVLPCCFDKDARYSMGHMQDKSLSEIWQSPPYISFRKRLLKSRKEIDICANCSVGTKIWG